MRVRTMQLFLLLSLALSQGCDTSGLLIADPGTEQAAASISVSASVTSLLSGQQTQLNAIVRDQSGREIPAPVVSWSSTTPDIATVSASGLVTAVAPGSASILAQSSDASTTITIPVTAAGSPPPVTQPVPPPVTTPSPAAMPATFLTTGMPAHSGRTINVPSGGDLQAAIDQAVPGDEIVLQAGATYTGNFNLPRKSGATTDPASSAVIVIRSSGIGSLPEGRRVSPASTSAMAKLVTATDGMEAIGTAAGATGWRLVGLEITAAPTVKTLGRLVRLGDGNSTQNSASQIPVNLVLDRVYVHGTSTLDVRRCIGLHSATSAVVDSYISECHSADSDAQAIGGWNGPGPYRIHDNYLEGSGENVMFGGATISVPNQVPSDIEITHNFFSKPLSWKSDDPSFAGKAWSTKNLLELKIARRVLIEGNVLEHSWVDGQVGFAMLIKTTDGATIPTSDITVRHNILRGAANGINLSGDVGTLARVALIDNLVLDIGSPQWAPAQDGGRLFQVMNTADVTISHNTGFAPAMFLSLDGSPSSGFRFTNNVISMGSYGAKGAGSGIGLASLTTFAPGFSFLGNVLIGDSIDQYPTGNFSSASIGAVGFANAAADDYSLTSASQFTGKATDGANPGVDMTALRAATSGAKP